MDATPSSSYGVRMASAVVLILQSDEACALAGRARPLAMTESGAFAAKNTGRAGNDVRARQLRLCGTRSFLRDVRLGPFLQLGVGAAGLVGHERHTQREQRRRFEVVLHGQFSQVRNGVVCSKLARPLVAFLVSSLVLATGVPQ